MFSLERFVLSPESLVFEKVLVDIVLNERNFEQNLDGATLRLVIEFALKN